MVSSMAYGQRVYTQRIEELPYQPSEVNIIQTKNNETWIGTEQGILIKRGRSYDKWELRDVDGQLLEITSIFLEHKNSYFVGTSNGLVYKLNFAFDTTRIPISDTILQSRDKILHLSAEGTKVWIGSDEGDIIEYNEANQETTVMPAYYRVPIHQIITNNEKIYMVVRENGLFFKRRKENSWNQTKQINRCKKILKVRDDFWLIGRDSTGRSLLLKTDNPDYDWDYMPLKCMPANQSKVLYNDIREGAKGVLWIATDNGVIKYDSLKHNCVRFSVDDYPEMVERRFSQVVPETDTSLLVSVPSKGLYRLIFGKEIIEKQDTLVDKKALANVTDINCNDTLILNQLLFQTSKADFINLADARAQMDILVQYLEEHPADEIELYGHTDNLSTNADYLMKLSEMRVNKVRDYLVDNGIKKSRVKALAFGGTKPIHKNTTEEGREKNRRVEVYVKCKFGE